MVSIQPAFNYQLLPKLSLSLISLVLFVCLTSSVEAASLKSRKSSIDAALTNNLENSTQPQRTPINLPASQPVKLAQKICPSGLSAYVSAITASFRVYICGTRGNPLAFVAVPNDNQNVTTMKIESANKNEYIAVNGNISYILNQQEFIILRDGQPIIRERVKRRKG